MHDFEVGCIDAVSDDGVESKKRKCMEDVT